MKSFDIVLKHSTTQDRHTVEKALIENRQNQLIQRLNVSETMAFFMACCLAGTAQKHFESVLPFLQVFKAGPSPKDVLQSPFLQARQCYRNAALLTDAYEDSRYQYCEGWAFKPHLIPLTHAWVSREKGTALDPTWEKFFDQEDVSHNEYTGFVFKQETLWQLLTDSGVYGVFENPRSLYKVFTSPQDYLELAN